MSQFHKIVAPLHFTSWVATTQRHDWWNLWLGHSCCVSWDIEPVESIFLINVMKFTEYFFWKKFLANFHCTYLFSSQSSLTALNNVPKWLSPYESGSFQPEGIFPLVGKLGFPRRKSCALVTKLHVYIVLMSESCCANVLLRELHGQHTELTTDKQSDTDRQTNWHRQTDWPQTEMMLKAFHCFASSQNAWKRHWTDIKL